MDDLNKVFIVLTTFVGFTTSVFSASYIGHEIEIGRLTPTSVRFYHAMYQVLMFAMNLALVANNIGLMWVAIEMATLTTVLMVGIYRTHEALEAAWKYFILGSVGIALALFGTILVYMAARPVIGEGLDAMVWTVLITGAAKFDPALLNVAFVFLLLGYGTKVGLAPLHAWLPDAHAEGPTPISAVLSGLLLNVALYALLRFKMLLALNPDAIAPGPLMVTMGLISCVFAAFMLYRRRDIKRMFAYSSIEHMGIIVFAFGMGGPLANFAGLLHMTMHSLTKSAIFFAVGHIAQVKGTQKIADMGGLTVTNPVLGWGLVLGVVAISRIAAARHFHERVSGGELDFRARAVAGDRSGARHSGRARRPVSAPQYDCLWRAGRANREGQGLLRADVRASRHRVRRRHLHAAGAGRRLPERRETPGIAWPCSTASRTPRRSHAPALAARRCSQQGWRQAIDQLAAGSAALLGLWGDAPNVHMALTRRKILRHRSAHLTCANGTYPSVGAQASAGAAAGARDPRSVRPGCHRLARHPALARSRFLGRASSSRQPDAAQKPAPYAFLPAEGEGLHQIPVGPVHAGIIEPGHFRFTANGEHVVRLEQRLGYVHKGIEALMAGATLDQAAKLAARTSGDSTVAYSFAFALAAEAASQVTAPPRARYLRALMAELERMANHFGDIGAICNDASFSLMHAQCGILRERCLRAAQACFGHRLMMDRIVPGGVAGDISAGGIEHVQALLTEVRRVFPRLIELYDNTASLQDRTVSTGIVQPDYARQFGAGGYVGRASGRRFDARAQSRLCAL